MGRIPTGATGARFLGETDADANAEMVAIVNDCVRRLLDEFPQLNVATTALTTVASQRYVSLPATLRGAEVMAVTWNDGSSYDGVQVQCISEQEVALLPRSYYQDDYSADYPEYYCIRREQVSSLGAIDFFPLPAGAKAFTLTHRVAETAFIVGELTTEVSTCPIPDAMIEVLCLMVAERLARHQYGWTSQEAVALATEAERLKSHWHNVIDSGSGQSAIMTFGFTGQPREFEGNAASDFSPYLAGEYD